MHTNWCGTGTQENYLQFITQAFHCPTKRTISHADYCFSLFEPAKERQMSTFSIFSSDSEWNVWASMKSLSWQSFMFVCYGTAWPRLWEISCSNIFANFFNRSKWNIWENGKFPEAEQQEIFQRIFWLNESIHIKEFNLGTLNENASRGKWEVSDMLH